jgi:LEA14-like dessication related protein
MYFALTAAAALFTLGCRSFQSVLQEPVLSIKSVELAGIDVKGIDMMVQVNVDNPNAFGIPLPRLEWELLINENSFISGEVQGGDRSVKARGSTVVAVPLSVGYTDLYNSFLSLKNSGEAAYTLALALSFPLPVLAEKTFHLEFSGSLPLPRLPKIAVESFDLVRADFNGVAMSCRVKVENPNAFDLPFPALDWEYSVNAVPLLKSGAADTRAVPAGGSASVEINLDMSYAELFSAVQSLTSRSTAPWAMKLGAVFAIPALENPRETLETAGAFPIVRKPELNFKGICARNVSLTRAEFVVTWEVVNRNNFAMTINNFDYDLKVNNAPWARGRLENPPQIAPNTATTIPLYITISSQDLLKSVTAIVTQRSETPYECGGSLSLSGDLPGMGTISLPFAFSGRTRLRN